ncbi:DUF5819 family protein [Glutamicibacter protophormiae]|nr:DUF5819 family protein [Glutamicibacter protophormiae]WPR68076.1 DUF5819 family protein [Glutamicibacter protophormiae]
MPCTDRASDRELKASQVMIGKSSDGGLCKKISVPIAFIIISIHFSAVFLHVAPLNPLSQQLNRFTQSWTQPFFAQNWQLFAPDPASSDIGLLVKGSHDGTEMGNYLDLSTPQLERKYHNLLPDNMHYTVSGVAHNLQISRQNVIEDPNVKKLHPNAINEQNLALDAELIESAAKPTRDQYHRSLRATIDLARDEITRELEIVPDFVQIRLVNHEFPRWSERNNQGLGNVQYSDTPWYDKKGNEVQR